jgi:hypothetical protein
MKIGDVKVGEIYGVVDRPSTTRFTPDPREAKVLEIVTVEAAMWNRYTRERGVKKTRQVKVELLTDPASSNGWRLDGLGKGATPTIEARQIVALWKDLAPDLLKKIEQQQASAAARDAMQARVDAILGPDEEWVTANVFAGKVQADCRFRGEGLERIVALAEKGLAS